MSIKKLFICDLCGATEEEYTIDNVWLYPIHIKFNADLVEKADKHLCRVCIVGIHKIYTQYLEETEPNAEV